MWAFQSFFGMFLDGMVGQVVHALSGAQPSGAWGPPPPRPSVAPSETAASETAAHDMDLRSDEVKLVEYSIVSVRRGHERILPKGIGEVMVTGSMTREGFTAWIVACYPHLHEVPPEDRRYLRVYYRVLTRWPRGRPGRGRRLAVLEGIRDAIHDLPRWPVRPAPAAPPEPSVITWDGTGTPSQVGARGRVTLTKTWNGKNYDVVLEGKLAFVSRSYGFVRHGLPRGYLPISADPLAYSCSIQQHAIWGDLSAVGNYGGRGVHVRNDKFPGYEGRATLWFPEMRYNGEVTLRCAWQTNEATDPSAWASCPGIEVVV